MIKTFKVSDIKIFGHRFSKSFHCAKPPLIASRQKPQSIYAKASQCHHTPSAKFKLVFCLNSCWPSRRDKAACLYVCDTLKSVFPIVPARHRSASKTIRRVSFRSQCWHKRCRRNSSGLQDWVAAAAAGGWYNCVCECTSIWVSAAPPPPPLPESFIYV